MELIHNWTNNRATRERDANEMIRWWQIILGVLIPLLINLGDTEFLYLGISCQTVASAAGIYVAILTALYRKIICRNFGHILPSHRTFMCLTARLLKRYSPLPIRPRSRISSPA
ncbi:MAG: hypothetical protein K8I82_24410 [Anaerolineae bacterium]|nr:hypothetical protein [Anaerolineae bacterium]